MEARTVLTKVLEILESTGGKYCILHGHRDFELAIESDVDCLIDSSESVNKLVRALPTWGLDVVSYRKDLPGAHYLVIASELGAPAPIYLYLDLVTAITVDRQVIYDSEALLEASTEFHTWWVLQPKLEFSTYLLKKLQKRELTDDHGTKLSETYHFDISGCREELANLWDARYVGLISHAAETGNWAPVRLKMAHLRNALHSRYASITTIIKDASATILKAMRQIASPPGLQLVVLGPDGVGKSTVISGVGSCLYGPFQRVSTHHLNPNVLGRITGATPNAANCPHALPPRPLWSSIAKLAYWWFDYSFGYILVVLPALARTKLVIFDRYLLDVLVDPKRYRYGGPRWAIRMVWRAVPHPDLVVLLDAPPEVVHSRKQELPIAEIAHQRSAYRSLVEELPNGHVVDATIEPSGVIRAVTAIAIRHMAADVQRRARGGV